MGATLLDDILGHCEKTCWEKQEDVFEVWQSRTGTLKDLYRLVLTVRNSNPVDCPPELYTLASPCDECFRQRFFNKNRKAAVKAKDQFKFLITEYSKLKH